MTRVLHGGASFLVKGGKFQGTAARHRADVARIAEDHAANVRHWVETVGKPATRTGAGGLGDASTLRAATRSKQGE